MAHVAHNLWARSVRLLPTQAARALLASSSITRERPKSATLQMLLSPTSTLRAAKSVNIGTHTRSSNKQTATSDSTKQAQHRQEFKRYGMRRVVGCIAPEKARQIQATEAFILHTSVDKVLCFEVSHASSTLSRHVDKLRQLKGTSFIVQVIQQTAVDHVF